MPIKMMLNVNYKTAWRYGLALIGLILSVLIATVHFQSHSQSTTGLAYGSTGDLQAQVVGPSNTSTLWKTYGVNAGDEIKWTAYVQPKTPNPSEIIGTHVLPSGHTWIKGHSQTQLSPNTTLMGWEVGGIWQKTEPATGTAVTRVKWMMEPGQTASGSSNNTPPAPATTQEIKTTARIHWSFTYGDRVYGLGNRDGWWLQSGVVLTCNLVASGAACPGFPTVTYPSGNPDYIQGGLDLDDVDGQPLQLNTAIAPHKFRPGDNMTGYFDPDTAQMYTALTTSETNTPRRNMIICTSVKDGIIKSCGSTVIGNLTEADYFYFYRYSAVHVFGAYQKKLYFLTADEKLSCYDIATKTLCPQSTKYTFFGQYNPAVNYYVMRDGKIMFSNMNRFQFCHDAATNTPCAGWTPDGIRANPAQGGYPYLNTDGSLRGVCTSKQFIPDAYWDPCMGVDGQPFDSSRNYRTFYNSYYVGNNPNYQSGSIFRNLGSIIGTKIYQGSPYVNETLETSNGRDLIGNLHPTGCFDFATDSQCGSFKIIRMVNAQSFQIDPLRKNCLMISGPYFYEPYFYPNTVDNYQDATMGAIYFIDPTTGKGCSAGSGGGSTGAATLTLDVNPADYYKCDPTRANVTAWKKLRLTPGALPWNATGGVSAIAVTLQDANGVALPVANNPRNIPVGASELDISDIPYATYKRLKFSLKLTPVDKINITDPHLLGVDATWDGDMVQQCFVTKMPATPACESRSTADITLTRMQQRKLTDNLYAVGLAVDETVSLGKVLSPNINYAGYAAVAAATTPRAVLGDLPDGELATRVVQGRYNLGASSFSGDAWVFGLNADSGQINPSNKALASGSLLLPASRSMFMAAPYSGTGAVAVQALNINNVTNPQQLAALNTTLSGVTDGKAADRVAYLQGTDGSKRARANNPLGPVINSGVSMLYTRAISGLSETNHPGYTAYRNDASKTRSAPLALWGGNDGAVHALKVNGATNSEAWSFVPDVMLRQANRYTDGNLEQLNLNPYFVDNIPMVGHANLASDTKSTSAADWRAVAAITYGRGARAITALDVTKENLGTGKGVLFEYTNTTPGDLDGDGQPDLQDLGHIVSQPIASETLGSQQIVKMQDEFKKGGRWAVLVGNGASSSQSLNPTLASAVLYVFYLDAPVNPPDSRLPRWRRIAVENSVSDAQAKLALKNNNGLSTPRPVDVDGDGLVDLVYAGDLQGNLWRFNVSAAALSSTTASGPTVNTTATVNPNVTLLFKTDAGQPIQGAPLVVRNSQGKDCVKPITLSASSPRMGCWQVMFGTGAYLTPLNGKNSAVQPTQILVGLLDTNTNSIPITKSDLVQKTYDKIAGGGSSAIDFRVMVTSVVDYAGGKKGWWTTLDTGENQVAPTRLLPSGQAMFTVVQPLDGSISTSCRLARSWLYLLDPLTGEASGATFDTNGDGVVDERDVLGGRTASAMALSGGSYAAPTVLLDAGLGSKGMSLLPGNLGQDNTVSNSWTGGQGSNGDNSKAIRSGLRKNAGRMTWREVF